MTMMMMYVTLTIIITCSLSQFCLLSSCKLYSVHCVSISVADCCIRVLLLYSVHCVSISVADCCIRVLLLYSSLEHFQEEFEDVSKEDQVISHIVMQLVAIVTMLP